MSQPPRALVAGGSIAGLFTALLLRQRGWSVRIYERIGSPLSGRGAGIVTHPQLWHILEGLGLDPFHDFGIEVQQRLTLGADGQIIGTLRCPQTMTAWDRLFSMLRQAWGSGDYLPGEEVDALEQTGNEVVATFVSGRREYADLVVGADGIRSSVRRFVAGDVEARYAGYTAWRGLLPEADMPTEAHAVLGHTFAFCLPDGEQMLGYPVAGEHNDLRPGHRRYNFVWYRPAGEATLANLLTDKDGHAHKGSIPPPLIRDSILADMRAAAEAVLAPQFAALVLATRQPFLQPIYDLETPAMVRGRVALVGDSAFVARPHVGAGVTKAAEDALALADALAAEPDAEQALLRYQAGRLPANRRIIDRARHLGAYMQAQLQTEDERAAADRHRTPAAVMAETALLDF